MKPERSTNLNVSVGGDLANGRIKWETIAFARDITDLIAFDGFDPATDQALAENVPGKVRVRGGELVIDAELLDVLSMKTSYTYSRAREMNDRQIDRVPEQQAKLLVDYHSAGQRFGATLTLDYVGPVYQSVWDGPERFGNYVVVDLAGRVFLDSAHHHLITARLENAFDRQYATSLGTTQRDSDGSNYTYWNLGVPRTLEARYNYRF